MNTYTMKTIQRLIKTFGNTIEVLLDGQLQETGRAFIQPLRYKNKIYLDGYYMPPGYCAGGHFLYIGPPDIHFVRPYENLVIRCEELSESYTVKRAETYKFAGRPVYVWAVLTPCTADLEESAQSRQEGAV